MEIKLLFNKVLLKSELMRLNRGATINIIKGILLRLLISFVQKRPIYNTIIL